MSTPPDTDASLVHRTLAGDAIAFTELADRHVPGLVALASSRLGDIEAARDVAQTAIFIAYRDLEQLQDPARFGAWVRGAARNLASRALERRDRERRLAERWGVADVATDPAGDAARNLASRQVLAAIDTLPERHREVVTRYYLFGLAVGYVSRATNTPSGSVKRMLSEARAVLREELIEMAREEMSEYGLTDEHRERLAKIPKFPRVEPKITITPMDRPAPAVRIVSVHGGFPTLVPGAETCFADYDHPGGKLCGLSHARTVGPVTVEGEECLRIDDVTFDADGKFDGGWRPHYRLIDENTVLYCAKQWSMSGKPVEAAPLLTPNHPDWGESQPHPESLLLRPGQVAPPDGDWNGNVVDEGLCKVKIGRRTFECVRRVGGGGVEEFEWSDGPVPDVATEEYFLPDGRLLLWRRYNGMAWSRKNPRRAKSRGAYELLVEAGLPELEVFDQVYRLWYDQIPEYAL